jgi:hypothetical protein
LIVTLSSGQKILLISQDEFIITDIIQYIWLSSQEKPNQMVEKFLLTELFQFGWGDEVGQMRRGRFWLR